MKSQKFTTPLLIALSVVIAASGPVSAVNAQAQTTQLSQSLAQFKQKVSTAIDSSIEKLKQSKENLNVSIDVKLNQEGLVSNVTTNQGTASSSVGKNGATATVENKNGSKATGTVNKDGASGSVEGKNGTSASGSVSKDGVEASAQGKNGNVAINSAEGTIEGSLSVPSEIKDKLKAANQKAIDKLEEMKEKVEDANKLEDLQAKAKEFDQAFKEIAIANIQASVTKSIDSMTKVLDRLQVAKENLQSQVTKIKECLQGIDVEANAKAGDGTVEGSFSASAPDCEDLNVQANSGDAAASLQEKLDAAENTMETIRTFLSSTISLVSELKTGSYTNTLSSFQGIASQVDIVANLSATIQNDLVNLSTSIRKA